MTASNFKDFVAPTSWATFIQEYYGVAPLHVARSREGYYSQYFDLSAFWSALESSGLRGGDVVMIGHNKDLVLSEFDKRPSQSEATRLLSEGATISLRGLESHSPTLQRLCAAVEAVFWCPVQANAYLSGDRAAGLPIHHDTHDVFVLQLEGRKSWRLYEPLIALPLPGQHVVWDKHFPPTPNAQLQLEPGDLLYLPRGLPHNATAVGGYSLHVTLGIQARTWTEVFIEAISEVALRSPAFREALPPQYELGRDPSTAGSAFEKLLETFRLLARPQLAMMNLDRDFIQTRRFPPLHRKSDLPPIRAKTTIKAQDSLIYRLACHHGQAILECQTLRLEAPDCALDTLKSALTSDGCAVELLAGPISLASKIAIVTRLVELGLVIVCEA